MMMPSKRPIRPLHDAYLKADKSFNEFVIPNG
jgi:hypothetical protein